MKRITSLLLTVIMIFSVVTCLPITTASAVEEGLTSVATVEPTSYGVLDLDVAATKVTIGEGYHLYSHDVDTGGYGEGYAIVKEVNSPTFYLVGTKGVVKKFYTENEKEPKLTLLREYSIDTPFAIYKVYNPETEKYDIYNANTCKYFEYGADYYSFYSKYDYTRKTICIEKDGKYGLLNSKGEMLYSPVYVNISENKNCFVGFNNESGNSHDDGWYVILSNNGTTSGTKLYRDILGIDNIVFAVHELHSETPNDIDHTNWALLNSDLTLMTDFIYNDVQIAEYNGTYYRVCSRVYEETDAYGDTDIYYQHQVISDNGNSWDVCQKFNCISSAVGIYNSSVTVCENGLKIYITDDYGYYDGNGTGWGNGALIIPEFNSRYILAKPNGEVVFNIAVTDENRNELRDRWDAVQGIYGKCEYRKEYIDNRHYDENLYDSNGNLISEITSTNMSIMGNFIVYRNYQSRNESFIYDYVNEKMVFENIYIYDFNTKTNYVCFAESEESGKWAIFDTATGEYTDYVISATTLSVTDIITNGNRKLWVCANEDKLIYVNDKFDVISTANDDNRPGCLFKSGDYLIKYVAETDSFHSIVEVEIIDYDGNVINSFYRKLYSDFGEAEVYASSDNYYGLINQSGETVIDNIADGVGNCYNGLSFIVYDDYEYDATTTIMYDIEYAAVVDTLGNALIYGKFDDTLSYYADPFNYVGRSGFVSFKAPYNTNVLYIYDFTDCHGFDRGTDSSAITEDMLFGEYNAFLNNGFYNKLVDTAGEQIANTLSQYTIYDKNIARVKSALDGQLGYVFEGIIDSFSGSSLNETKLKQEMALEYLNSLDTDAANNYLETISEINNIASKINNANKLDYDLKSEASKVEFVKIWTDGTGFTSSEIYNVIDTTKKHQDRFDAYFDATGTTISVLEYLNSYLTIYLLQRDLVKTLMDLVPENSDLYEGLNYIYIKQSKSGTVATLVLEMLTDAMFEIVEELAEEGIMKLLDVKNANLATFVLSVCCTVASHMIDSPKLEDIDKAILAYSNMITLKTAVNNYQQTIADNYEIGGEIPIETLKSEYSLLCNTFYKSIFTALKYTKEIATEDDKAVITRYTDEFERKLIYRSYIKTCLLNARTNWEYTVEANKAVLTKLKAEYPSGEGRVPYMELYNSDFDDSTSKPLTTFEYAIDVPSSIEGYTVSSVGTESFDDNRITGVYIPDTVTEIQDSAFKNCSQINAVYLGSSVQTIGDSAFENCNNLSYMDIPESVSSIGENTFAGVENLLVTGANEDILANVASDTVATQKRDPIATTLEITSNASKTEFNMQEEIDTTNLAITVTYADGSTKNITEGFYADIYSRAIGENTVVVFYEGLKVEYNVNILASECDYSIAYQDELGNELADRITGTAVAGSTLDLEIPEIEGYTPINKTQTEIIGYSNNFIVKYTENPKTSIDNAIVTIEDQYFANKDLIPEVKVKLGDVALTEDKDFTVIYENNYQVGTAMVVIIGTGDYDGILTANFRILEKTPDASGSYLYGDVNQDSKINIKDATTIQKYLANLIDLSDLSIDLADVNADNKVNIKDATTIQKHCANLNPKSIIGEIYVEKQKSSDPTEATDGTTGDDIVPPIISEPVTTEPTEPTEPKKPNIIIPTETTETIAHTVEVITTESTDSTTSEELFIIAGNASYSSHAGDTITYYVELQADELFEDIQGSVFYDSTKLKLIPQSTAQYCPLLSKQIEDMYDLGTSDFLENEFTFAAVEIVDGFDFTEKRTLVMLEFEVLETGTTSIDCEIDNMTIFGGESYYFYSGIAGVTDGITLTTSLE